MLSAFRLPIVQKFLLYFTFLLRLSRDANAE
jgi:hypothetical protein